MRIVVVYATGVSYVARDQAQTRADRSSDRLRPIQHTRETPPSPSIPAPKSASRELSTVTSP